MLIVVQEVLPSVTIDIPDDRYDMTNELSVLKSSHGGIKRESYLPQCT